MKNKIVSAAEAIAIVRDGGHDNITTSPKGIEALGA